MELPQLLTLFFGSASIATLATGLLNYFRDRKLARIQERKNVAEEDTEVVKQWQAIAESERTGKESAVRTINDLLTIAERQNAGLRETIKDLTNTIGTMNDTSQVQLDLVKSLTAQRDHLQNQLDKAQAATNQLTSELMLKMREGQPTTGEIGVVA